MRKIAFPVIAVAILCALMATLGWAGIINFENLTGRSFASNPAQRTLSTTSRSYFVDKIYTSMNGPQDRRPFIPMSEGDPELIWLTGARAEILEAGKDRSSPEYLCHSFLLFDDDYANRNQHRIVFGNSTTVDSKLISLVQGQLAVKLPPKFGIPLLSSEPLQFTSMVINPRAISQPIHLSVKNTFEYVRDRDLDVPMKALARHGIGVLVPVQKPANDLHSSQVEACEGHAAGMHPAPSDDFTREAANGEYLSYHWFVPPGSHTYRSEIKGGIVPFDTTVHLITAHLHPHGEYVELIDKTAGASIFKSTAKHSPDRYALVSLEQYSSAEGIALYKDHVYEIITHYDNKTTQLIDAMASIHLYYWDKHFSPTPLAAGQKS